MSRWGVRGGSMQPCQRNVGMMAFPIGSIPVSSDCLTRSLQRHGTSSNRRSLRILMEPNVRCIGVTHAGRCRWSVVTSKSVLSGASDMMRTRAASETRVQMIYNATRFLPLTRKPRWTASTEREAI